MNISAYRYLKFYTFLLLFIALTFFLLREGRVLFVPLGFGFLISVILHPICRRVERFAGRAVGIAACLLILLVFGFLVYQLLTTSISLLQDKFTLSQDKIATLMEQLLQLINSVLDIDEAQYQGMAQQLQQNLVDELIPLLKQTVYFSAGSLAMLLIIPIFVALILYYRELLVRFVLGIVPDNQVQGFTATIHELSTTYFRFAKGMALVYLIVGVLNSLGFLLIGLPNAIYLGVLAALLTFFPYVGIMIGGLAAVIVAWTTYDSVWYPLGVVAVLGVVQYLEANVIFPLTVGHQLRINPFATFIAILLGGLIWGGAGMILFIPFAAILKILSDQIPEMQPLSVLLSEESHKPSRSRWRLLGKRGADAASTEGGVDG